MKLIIETNKIPKNFTGIVESDLGGIYYYQDGLYHRLGGPAKQDPDGSLWWYKEGRLHREDGPAYIFKNIEEYYIEGEEISKRDFLARRYADLLDPLDSIEDGYVLFYATEQDKKQKRFTAKMPLDRILEIKSWALHRDAYQRAIDFAQKMERPIFGNSDE